MADTERAHCRKTSNPRPRNRNRRAPHKQVAALRPNRGRGDSAGLLQLKVKAHKCNEFLLSQGCGKRGISADIPQHSSGVKQAMNPVSLTSSSSSEGDLSFDGPRTKVVVRGLPPSLSEKAFTESIPPHFHALFNWIYFSPGKTRKGNRGCHSRVYLDFKNPEDVFKFMDEFSGHLFVNEKGSKCRAVVEYALHQKVPRPFSEEDTQEGSISKDPEYLEFLEGLAKPIKVLPSAEVQLEWKEAEKSSSLAAGAHETVIVTPLMEYVRHKRGLRAENVFVASMKKSARQGSSASAKANLIASSNQAASLNLNARCSANAVKRHEKRTYVPRRHHEANEFKEVPQDTKRTAGEVQGGGCMPVRDLVGAVQKSGGSRQSGGSGQVRKDGKSQHPGKGKKSKQTNGFRSHEKHMWVAKPGSGS